MWWQIFRKAWAGEILLRDCVPNRAEFLLYPQVQSHQVFVWEAIFLCLPVSDPRTPGVPRTFMAIKYPPWTLGPKLLSHSHGGQRFVWNKQFWMQVLPRKREIEEHLEKFSIVHDVLQI